MLTSSEVAAKEGVTAIAMESTDNRWDLWHLDHPLYFSKGERITNVVCAL